MISFLSCCSFELVDKYKSVIFLPWLLSLVLLVPFLCFSYIFLFVRPVILSRFSWFFKYIFFPFSQFVSLLFPSRYSFSFLFLYLLNLLICSPFFLQFLWVFYLLFYYFISSILFLFYFLEFKLYLNYILITSFHFSSLNLDFFYFFIYE